MFEKLSKRFGKNEGLGEKSVKTFFDNIEKSKSNSLSQVLLLRN